MNLKKSKYGYWNWWIDVGIVMWLSGFVTVAVAGVISKLESLLYSV